MHPIVIFSVLDHYTRRQEGQERVIGTLLGTKDAFGNVEVTNCFAVPHTENAGEVAVGQATNKSMFALLSRINSREKIVGWYATTFPDGSKLDDSSTLMHDFYSQECENPCHLVVDATLSTEKGVKIEAFATNKSSFETNDVLSAFVTEVPVEVAFSEPELLCISQMIKGQPEPFTDPQALASLDAYKNDKQGLQESLANISDLLETCIDYCYDVQEQKRTANPDTTRHILNALDSLQGRPEGPQPRLQRTHTGLHDGLLPRLHHQNTTRHRFQNTFHLLRKFFCYDGHVVSFLVLWI